MRERSRQGALEYGERSWSREPHENISEAMEELVDTSNWACMAYTRLRQLRDKLETRFGRVLAYEDLCFEYDKLRKENDRLHRALGGRERTVIVDDEELRQGKKVW